MKYAGSFENVILVLIETLWNVNDDAELISPVRDESINRNIVECK